MFLSSLLRLRKTALNPLDKCEILAGIIPICLALKIRRSVKHFLLRGANVTPEKRRQISEMASAVRRALKLQSPIDVNLAVNNLGGTLEFVDPDEIAYEAIVEKQPEGFRIRIANDRAEARQNFSVAHEIAHLFLHMGYIVSPEKWNNIVAYEDSVRARHGYTEEEYEAHQFAAAFLMPEDEFLEVAKRAYAGGKYDLSAISEHFGVSLKAAKTRGQWLGLFSWD